jgi:hypothetical protein
LVSIEQDTIRQVKHIIRKINEALTEIGDQPWTRVDEFHGIFIVGLRRIGGAFLLYGNGSKLELMVAVLSALADCKIISQDFGKSVLYAWMKADEPPKE